MKTWDIDDKVDAVYEMRMEQVDHAIRTGGPASGGLTVRDYFAAIAMQSMNSREDYVDACAAAIALDSYALADAMMAERDKKPQTACSVEEAFGL